jgi:Restriction endonuclease fold toxin 5
MLQERLREEWRARERAVPVYPVMTIAPDGLVLGAGTVLLRAEGPGRLQDLRGEEARILALLAAAYGRAVAPAVLGNIGRAVKSWREGDGCLAHIHLAHSGLRPPGDLRSAACRLFVAESAMKAGMSPRAILHALKIGSSYVDTMEKTYNSDEPRIPAGSGKPSGEWTSGAAGSGDDSVQTTASTDSTQDSSLLGRMPAPAPSFLGTLDAAQVAELGAYAARMLGPIGGAAAAFGLLFIPSPNNVRVEGEVPEMPGLRYSSNRDETLLHLTYADPDGGQRIFSARLDGDEFRDAQGRVVGRVLSDSTVAVDAAAVSSDLFDDDEPRLCPDTAKDKRTNDLGLDFENYIKSIVNPENPTPTYMGYMLSKVAGSVAFDDCQHSTGTMVEIKDGYANFLDSDWGKAFVARIFIKQAMDQVQAAGGRPLRWYFSQKAVADYARQIFSEKKELKNIEIKYEPWPGRTQ